MDSQISQHLLRLLARAATQCVSDRAQAFETLRQAIALLHQLQPPGTPPLRPHELERMLSVPIEQWLPEDVRGDYEGALLTDYMLTSTGSEMLFELAVEQVWENTQKIVARVRDACRLRANGQTLYRNFRLFLIQNGTVQPAQTANVLVPLGLQLTDLYQPIPAHLVEDNAVFLCPVCGWPMNPLKSEVNCDSSWCRQANSVFRRRGSGMVNRLSSKALEPTPVDGAWMLLGALWKFTLLPGRLELDLADALTAKGYEVEMWPDYDRIDLRVTHQGQCLEIDAKVWRSAHSLAAHIRTLTPTSPQWIVIPDYQKANIGFLRDNAPPGIEVFTQKQCIKEVAKRANPF